MSYMQDPLEDVAPDVRQFAIWMAREVTRARKKFPRPDALMTALTEEVGELAKAMLDEPSVRVVAEAIQVAAMACRVAMEGDPTLDETRKLRIGRGDPAGTPEFSIHMHPLRGEWWRDALWLDKFGY
jgi:hypothetical protein